MQRLLLTILLLTAAAAPAVDVLTMEALAEGRPWKLVWLADDATRLMALDPGGEPRELLAGQGRLARPLVNADGSGVFVTRLSPTDTPDGTAFSPEMFAIPWTGGPPRSLGSGIAVAVHAPSDAVYGFASLQTTKRQALTGETVFRFKPAKPDDREIVWAERPAAVDNFMISRDGSRAGGLFPWPQAGLIDLSGNGWKPVTHGAWPSLAPDDSFAMLVLDGTRRRLGCFVPEVDPGWSLDLGTVPPLAGGGIGHPRWSNDPRILTATGPWPEEGGGEARVIALRLRGDLKAVEAVHVAASTTGRVESPDLWVAGGGSRTSDLPQQPRSAPARAAAAWPTVGDGVVMAWERLGGSAPDPVLHGMAFPDRCGGVNVSAGTAEFPADAVKRAVDAIRASGAWSLECMISERRSPPPVSTRLVSLRHADGRDLATLYRVDGKLVLRTLTGEGAGARQERLVLTSMFIEEDRPFSLVVTCRGRRMACYVDGQEMKTFTLSAPVATAWEAGRLVLGDERQYGGPWTGSIERLALHSRELAKDEVEAAWQQTATWLNDRTRPTRCLVKVKLIEWPELPADAAGAAPRRLSASTWEVEQVFTGSVEAKKITVLHWAVLDGKAVPRPDIRPGQSMELSLEPAADHPELTDVPTHDALTSREAPAWFDAAVPGRHKPPFPPTSTP